MSKRLLAGPCVFLSLALTFGAGSGCVPSLGGNLPREPNRRVPPAYRSSPQQLKTTSAAMAKWKELFDSVELQFLITTALKNNQELNLRMQEIIIAQTEISARRGEYAPKLNAELGAGIEKVGKHTSQGASDEAHGLPEHLGDFNFGLRGSWEVDVWKKLRNAAKAADLRFLASIEARNFMATQIIAEIARSYYELMAIDNRIAILKRNIDIQASALEVVKLEKIAARVTELAVQRFEAEVLKNKSRLYDLNQAQIQTENRINFLVGRFPQHVKRASSAFNERSPKLLHAGLPSELLQNRPDVRQAELELAAAKLDVSSARAAFYPSLFIDAEVGYRSFNAAHLVDTPDSLIYNLAGGLVAPLLNRQAISAQYRSANARQLQAVFNFERILLQAFTDVANQLAKIGNLQKSYELRAQQVQALARSIDISNVLFQSARADYMEVLLTRRDSLEAEMELLETKTQQFHAMVDLYQSLGGGWRS